MGSLLLGTLRQLRRRWGFGLLVSGTLSLGLAAVLVALAMVQSSLERAAPFPNRARILWLGQASERESDAGVSFPAVERWRQSASSIEDIALFTERGASLTRRGQSAYVTVALVSAPYFRILGLPFRAGRDFSASDDRPSAAPVAIVSERFLTRHGIPLALAVGQHIELNSVSHEVVGVIAESGAHPSRETDIWARAARRFWSTAPAA